MTTPNEAIALPVEPAEFDMSLTEINALAKAYCSSHAGPNYIVFTLDDLRDMIAALPVKPDQPDSELEISDAVVERMSIILAKISITLNGPEQPSQRHSYHDLAEKVAVLQLEVDLYRHQAAPPVEPAPESKA